LGCRIVRGAGGVLSVACAAGCGQFADVYELPDAVACGAFAYSDGVVLLPALDAWAPCATLVWAFLAMGHFAEGSDPGMPTALPWGVTMPGDMVRQHPVGLYAAAAALMLTAALYGMLKRRREAAAAALIGAGLAQFLLSFVRVPGFQSVAGLDALQVVALGMIVAGCGLWMSSTMKEARS
jgi:phosphatidylglycerol:prolipoprotein diacylglycerol transferase